MYCVLEKESLREFLEQNEIVAVDDLVAVRVS
jgi:hypothetical protein